MPPRLVTARFWASWITGPIPSRTVRGQPKAPPTCDSITINSYLHGTNTRSGYRSFTFACKWDEIALQTGREKYSPSWQMISPSLTLLIELIFSLSFCSSYMPPFSSGDYIIFNKSLAVCIGSALWHTLRFSSRKQYFFKYIKGEDQWMAFLKQSCLSQMDETTFSSIRSRGPLSISTRVTTRLSRVGPVMVDLISRWGLQYFPPLSFWSAYVCSGKQLRTGRSQIGYSRISGRTLSWATRAFLGMDRRLHASTIPTVGLWRGRVTTLANTDELSQSACWPSF